MGTPSPWVRLAKHSRTVHHVANERTRCGLIVVDAPVPVDLTKPFLVCRRCKAMKEWDGGLCPPPQFVRPGSGSPRSTQHEGSGEPS